MVSHLIEPCLISQRSSLSKRSILFPVFPFNFFPSPAKRAVHQANARQKPHRSLLAKNHQRQRSREFLLGAPSDTVNGKDRVKSFFTFGRLHKECSEVRVKEVAER